MIKSIHFEKYKKFHNINFDFQNDINVIAGTNGTCKTSLLHVISNTFKSVNKKTEFLNDEKCIPCINSINNLLNPKIETLSRGDKKYNGPAKDHKGTLYTVQLIDDKKYLFRRHDSKKYSRFSVKLYYKKGTKESLQELPVIYLGLSRLFPYGEYQNDKLVTSINKNLPEKYQREIEAIYKIFTGIEIETHNFQNMGDIKRRAEFITKCDGIDSNTISAGEDNLYIILTALVSLKYYYESINSQRDIESILLVDEIDSTLHPEFQIKLLDLLKEYTKDYKIQIFFTSHSLTLIEYALRNKHKVIYIRNDIDDVRYIDDIDIYYIKMNLLNKTRDDIYTPKKIPIFSEDEEARTILRLLIDFFESKDKNGFGRIRNYFYIVDASISADSLTKIFNDAILSCSILSGVCLLDGDRHSQRNLNNNIIVLPGKDAPEKFLSQYAEELFKNDDKFWDSTSVDRQGFSKNWYRAHFKNELEEINNKISQAVEQNQSTKGMRRSLFKDFFNKHKKFFIFLFTHWLNDTNNQDEICHFYCDLFTIYKKLSAIHDIDPKEWKEKIQF